jgi:Ca2+/Na+ antiporter
MDASPGQPPISTASADDETPIPFYGLRVAGFLITVVGALLAGVGAIQAWIDVSPKDQNLAVLTIHDVGIDLWQGKVVLALAVVALVAVLVTRIGASSRSRKIAAAVLLCTGLAIVGVAVYTVARGADDAIEAIAQAERLDDQASLLIGVWLTLGGGVLVIVGAALTLMWSGRVRYDDDRDAAVPSEAVQNPSSAAPG